MHKGLYDSFSHWFHEGGGQVWFYSDPHFDDKEMQHLRQDYIGDEEQVKRINSKIGKYDTLVILGDIGNIEYVRQLRGYKVLVKGNHDKGSCHYKRVSREEKRIGSYEYVPKYEQIGDNEFRGAHIWKEVITQSRCDNYLFDEVYEGMLLISPKVILSHEPVDFPYAFNIHGHDHSGWSYNDKMHFNVCAERIDYTPVGWKQIMNSGLLKDIPDIHRETIDKASGRA